MTTRHVVFSHGRDAGPWGSKTVALADIARAQGFVIESVDYRGIDDPYARVVRLCEHCRDLTGRLALVGSGLGGHVATAAGWHLRPHGIFLLAPAFYMPSYAPHTPPRPPGIPMEIVHGVRDEVVPVENSLRYAREYGVTLHAYDADHRMHDRLTEIGRLFEYFVLSLERPRPFS